MKAVGFREFGGPEVLEIVEIPEPQAGPGEVRIQVHAATVSPTCTVLRQGWSPAARTQTGPPYVPGMDAAGVVDQVGAGVDWQVGDRVMAIVLPDGTRGANAQKVVVPADSVARIPAGADFAAASTLPMNGLTARLGLDQLGLAPGQTLAVTGAAGAFGGYTVQLAKADGLRVIADAAPSDEALVRGLGADEIVARGDDVAERIRELVPEGVDGLADGALLNGKVAPAIKDGGGLVVVRGWDGEAGRGITVHRILVRNYAREQAKLDRLRQQAEDGAVTLRVARTFPPAQAAEAHRVLEAGGRRGGLVIDLSSWH
jgi:NADPH:quinone reductase-like Zn-dependent oxidoreductase